MSKLREPTSQRPSPRGSLTHFSGSSRNRSVQIGIVGTLLIHLLLFLIVPHLLRLEHPPGELSRVKQPDPFEIELGSEETKQPDPFKFVETNPDAPENAPDKSDNFSDRDQQAAQEKETPDMTGDRPAMEGQTEIQSDRIVTGQLTPIIPPAPSAPAQQETPTTEDVSTQAQREQIPLSGFENDKSDADDSYGSNVAKLPDGRSDVDKYVEGVKDAPIVEGATGKTAKVNPQVPRPRPTLQKRARPAIFSENNVGTSNIGPIGLDAHWSNYGQYLQELIETVQIQWDRILIQSKVYPTPGTKVVVSFILNNKGEVSRIIGVEGTSGELGKQSCVSAITDRAPYGEWTDDMRNVLGKEQHMTFTFFYQ